MITTLFVTLGINTIFLAVAVIIILRRLENRIRKPVAYREMADEINGLIVEMNRTSDENVNVLEDRIDQLKKTIAEADKRLLLLEKQLESGRKEKELYSNLGNGRPIELIPFATNEEVGIEAGSGNEAVATPPESAEETVKEERSVQAQVLELHKQGISTDIIAGKLDVPLGEIELIIALKGQR